MKKKMIILVLIFIFIFLSIILYFNFTNSSIEKIKNSVLKIQVYDKKNNIIQTGSGFIAFDNNILITNAHVITGGYKVEAIDDKDVLLAIDGLLYYSQDEDIAILKLNKQNKISVLKTNTKYKIGDKVVAIGSPLGVKNSVSEGTLSNIIENQYIQHTAPISSGSSGGALFNKRGQVIGMNTATYIDGQNMNIAIPISTITNAYNNSKNSKTKSIYKSQFYSNDLESILLNNDAGKKIVAVLNKYSENNRANCSEINPLNMSNIDEVYSREIYKNSIIRQKKADYLLDCGLYDYIKDNNFIESMIAEFTVIKLTNVDSAKEIIDSIYDYNENKYDELLIKPESNVGFYGYNGSLKYSSRYVSSYKEPKIGLYNNYIYYIVTKKDEISSELINDIKKLP